MAAETHTAPLPQTSPPKSTKSIKSTKPQDELIIRKAHLLDSPEIGRIASKTYKPEPLSSFIAPNRYLYPRDWELGFVHRAQKRMFDARNLTFVVVQKGNPGKPVGYAQFIRLGDDEGARRQVESHSLIWRVVLWVLGVLFACWCVLGGWVRGGDRSVDPKALKTFEGWAREDGRKHWDEVEERGNRWHVQSVVVREEFQGRGAGKMLMAEVIGRAEAENVVIGLESSAKGEYLYRSVGFNLLARFSGDYDFEEQSSAGGVMMYTPKAMRGEKI